MLNSIRKSFSGSRGQQETEGPPINSSVKCGTGTIDVVFASYTDIGGMRENQDATLVWRPKPKQQQQQQPAQEAPATNGNAPKSGGDGSDMETSPTTGRKDSFLKRIGSKSNNVLNRKASASRVLPLLSNANKADTSNAPFSSITDQPAKDSSSQVQEDRLPPIASTEEAATTDGGGGENTSPSTTVGGLVVAVLDGHGSDLGREASHRAAEGMAAWLDQHFATRLAPEGADVVMAMRDLFQHTHAHLFEAYKMLLRARGFEVEEQHGYLVRRRIAGNNAPPTSSRSRLMRRQRSGGLDASKRGKLEQAGWECVHGGTSASVVAFLNQGRTMIVANVGDSAGLLAVEGLHLGDYTHLRKPLTPSLEAQGFPALGAGEVVIDVGDQVAEEEVEARERRCMVLTADHSPESLAEFDRMRRTHPNPKTKHWPFLQLVYDEPGKRKVECPRVFDFDNRGKLGVTNNGRYYKNVRQEWASLVTTPSTARFHDALAFTRSLGDFHLHANGLSCLPEVFEVDLQAIRNLKKSGSNSSSGGGGSVLGVLALASDGVWDNWDWDEVADYVLQPDHLRCLRDQGPDTSAQRFKQANTDRARANFGGDSDNASGVMCYISL